MDIHDQYMNLSSLTMQMLWPPGLDLIKYGHKQLMGFSTTPNTPYDIP